MSQTCGICNGPAPDELAVCPNCNAKRVRTLSSEQKTFALVALLGAPLAGGLLGYLLGQPIYIGSAPFGPPETLAPIGFVFGAVAGVALGLWNSNRLQKNPKGEMEWREQPRSPAASSAPAGAASLYPIERWLRRH
jgi:membrane protein YqaA with SNARE-associated domain